MPNHSPVQIGFYLPYVYGPAVHYARAVSDFAESLGFDVAWRARDGHPRQTRVDDKWDRRVDLGRQKTLPRWLDENSQVLWWHFDEIELRIAAACQIENILVASWFDESHRTLSHLEQFSMIVCPHPTGTRHLCQLLQSACRALRLPLDSRVDDYCGPKPTDSNRATFITDSATMRRDGLRLLQLCELLLDDGKATQITLIYPGVSAKETSQQLRRLCQRFPDRFVPNLRPTREQRLAAYLATDWTAVLTHQENSGFYADESWRLGRPVAAFNTALWREFIKEGVQGWLIPCAETREGVVEFNVHRSYETLRRIFADPGSAPLAADYDWGPALRARRSSFERFWKAIWRIQEEPKPPTSKGKGRRK